MGVLEGKIDLGAGKVVTQAFKPDARAMVAIEEVLLIEATVKADPRFQEALRRRGLLNELEYMCVDPWTVGNFGHAIENGRRVLNCFVWMRTFPLDNYYAHPVEGLHALVDLATLEILRVEDHFEASGDYIPVPRIPLNFDADVLTEFREPSALPWMSAFAAGAGFTVVGNKVTGRTGTSGSGSTAARAGPVHDRLHARRLTPRSSTARRSPSSSCLRDDGAQPLPQERFRSRRARLRPWPTRSSSAATASARSATWTRTSSTRRASRSRSRTPSASTRRTRASPGSISMCEQSGPRCAVRAAW